MSNPIESPTLPILSPPSLFKSLTPSHLLPYTYPTSNPTNADTDTTTTTTTKNNNNNNNNNNNSTPLPLPSSSRVDPSITQRLPPQGGILGWGSKNWLGFVWFLASKGVDVVGDLVKYGLWGPPKKSWGIEMTLVCAFMRNLSAHSSLTDITLIRQLISVHYLLPLPPDAMVTPITFLVKKRKEPLRGFFHNLDITESGERELSGEWVVGRNVWKRLKSERMKDLLSKSPGESERRGSFKESRTASRDVSSQRAGSTTTSVTPSTTRLSNSQSSTMDLEARRRKRKRSEKIIYYIHGGAYYLGTASTHRLITIAISKVCDARVFAINYRLSPEVRFPCALHDVIRGYMRLTDSLKISPENIIVMGDSAGGSLAIALTMYLRDEGYRLPRALVVMSPWVDMTMSCGSWDENAKFDVIPMPEGNDHLNPIQCYMGPEGMKDYLTHPYASPLFGDFTGLPPMLIQAGDAEVLRDEITLLAHKAKLSGVEVKSELFVDAVHVFQAFPFLEAATVAFKSIGKFVNNLKDRDRALSKEILRRTSAMDVANDEDSKRPRSTSVDPSGSPRGSVDSAGVDKVDNEMTAGGLMLVRSDGTEVQGKEAEAIAEAEDVFGIQETIKLPERTTRRHAPSDAVVDTTPTTSRATTPKPPSLRRAISALANKTTPNWEQRRRPSVSFLTPSTPADPPYTLPSPRSGSTRSSRRGSVVAHLTLSPAKPTTRLRSRSNVDMVDLVESYSRQGPAMQTVVYTPTKGTVDLPDEDAPEAEDGERVEGS